MDAVPLQAMGSEQPGHDLWPDGLSITDENVFDRSNLLGPNQITDVHLLGLAVRNGRRLGTLDCGLALTAVRGAGAGHLVAL
jgi:hypothetical protein